ncbi:hypothetical protein Tco_0733660 [Tanacetum coccineum]
MPYIVVTLLSITSGLHFASDLDNILGGFMNDHFNAGVVTVIVGEFNQGRVPKALWSDCQNLDVNRLSRFKIIETGTPCLETTSSKHNHASLSILSVSLIDEPTQGILDITTGGIFLYKSPNQAFQFLDDKVLFKLDWSTKSQNEHHQKSVAFADGSNSNDDNSRLMETLEALTIKMDSKFHNLNEEMHEMRKNYNNRGGDYASKNDDTPMCERHEVNYIQSEELNNDVKNDLEDFKRCIHSMRTVHDKLFDRDDQSKTDLEKSITKFLDSQRISNMFVKNNINDIIIKMKQNEKNCQIIYKNMERKVDEWSKSQNVSSEQTDRTEPPPTPQAQTEHANAVFTESGKSDDSPKIQKDPPPPIIVNNKTEKDEPIKT